MQRLFVDVLTYHARTMLKYDHGAKHRMLFNIPNRAGRRSDDWIAGERIKVDTYLQLICNRVCLQSADADSTDKIGPVPETEVIKGTGASVAPPQRVVVCDN